MLRTLIRIIAKNPPSIVLVFAGILALAGQAKEAYDFLYAGIFMQTLWILGKYAFSRR